MIIYYTDNFKGGREESRRLLNEALGVYTGDAEQAKTLIGILKKGEHGKPYIEGFSCFSISHTGSIWAVLFADRECGLDIQLSRKCDIMSISERFFNPEDAAVISSLCEEYEGRALSREEKEYPATARDAFFCVWTRREALIKALGGSVADTDLPAVMTGSAAVGCMIYTINDIQITDMPELYAAICLQGDAPDYAPEICRLNDHE